MCGFILIMAKFLEILFNSFRGNPGAKMISLSLLKKPVGFLTLSKYSNSYSIYSQRSAPKMHLLLSGVVMNNFFGIGMGLYM